MFLETSGIAITEPMTMATDYVLAMQAWLHGRALRRMVGEHSPEILNKWIRGFYAAAWGALAGGTLHGFQLILSRSALIFLLLATVVAVTAGAFLFLEAGIASARQPAATGALRPTPWVRAMAASALIAGLIAFAGPSLHEHFNQNDLAHIVLMLGLYCGYRAVSPRGDLNG